MSARRGIFWSAFFLLAAAFLGRALALARTHPYPLYDEVAELELARGFAARGTLGTIECYLRGGCREDNRHPLYPMLLAAAATDGPEDFAKGKLLSAVCGLVLLMVVAYAGWRLAGGEGAFWSTAAVALSPAAAVLSSSVAADALFALLYVKALLLLAEAGDGLWDWTAFGLCAGFAYLAKGSGHFLFLSALAVAWTRWGRKALAKPHLYVAAGAFALVAGFLLWRNTLVWGSPFHNINSKEVWLDDWGSFWRLSASPEWANVGALWYFRSHSLAAAAFRFARGLARIFAKLLRAFGVGPFRSASWTGFPLLLLALYGLFLRWRDGKRQQVAAFAVTDIVLLAAFAWAAQPIGALLRYVVPVAASLVPFSVIGALALAERLAVPRRPVFFKAAAAVAAVVLLVSSRVGFSDPLAFWAQPDGWHEAGEWLKASCPEGYLLDPDSRFSDWERAPDLRRLYPLGAPAAELKDQADKEGVRCALLQSEEGPADFLGWPRCAAFSNGALSVYDADCPSGRKGPLKTGP